MAIFFRLAFLWLAITSASVAIVGCTLDEPKPQYSAQQLVTGSWLLEEIRQSGQVSASGATIKDRYSLDFNSDGTYTQKLLADNSTYQGTWALMDDKLRLKDHKGTDFAYTMDYLTTAELRYNFINKNGQFESLFFSAQP